MERSVDAELIAAAMTLALRASPVAPHPRPAASLLAADHAAAVRSLRYETPTGPDMHGFLAIGELHDQPRRRTGIVLFHPATQSVRVTWRHDPPAAD